MRTQEGGVDGGFGGNTQIVFFSISTFLVLTNDG